MSTAPKRVTITLTASTFQGHTPVSASPVILAMAKIAQVKFERREKDRERLKCARFFIQVYVSNIPSPISISTGSNACQIVVLDCYFRRK